MKRLVFLVAAIILLTALAIPAALADANLPGTIILPETVSGLSETGYSFTKEENACTITLDDENEIYADYSGDSITGVSYSWVDSFKQSVLGVYSKGDAGAWKLALYARVQYGDGDAVTSMGVYTADGTLISTLAEDPFNGAADCAKAFTCPCGGTTYIDKNGVLHSNCIVVAGKEADIQAAADAAGKDGKPAKIQWFSCSGDHAAVSFESGKVLAFGENGYLQCRTGNWQLLPFENSGYIYGIAPGTKDQAGKDVKTGDSFTLADGTSGTAVILGDVD